MGSACKTNESKVGLTLFLVFSILSAYGVNRALADNATASQAYSGTVPSDVRNKLVIAMVRLGYQVRHSDEFTITFEAPFTGIVTNLLFSTPAGGSPVERVIFTLTRDSLGTQVTTSIAMVSNAGTAFEKQTDISTGADAPAIQSLLTRLYEQPIPAIAPIHLGFQSEPLPGGKGMVVRSIEALGIAEKAGVRVDDVITALNGHTVRSVADLREAIADTSGKRSVSISVARGGRAKKIPLITRAE